MLFCGGAQPEFVKKVSGYFFLTSRKTYDKITIIREKAMKEKSRYPKRYREKTVVQVFAGRIVKQFRSFEPNGVA